MVISLSEYELSYTPVPKASSTAVKIALTVLDPDVSPKLSREISLDAHRVHKLYPTRRYRRVRLLNNNQYSFTVVRDPVARLLSVYSNRLFREAETSNFRRRGWAPLPSKPDPDYFFENLDAYRASSKSVKHDSVRQVVFTGDDLSVYDKVYRSEALGELERDLTGMTGKVIAFPQKIRTEAPLSLRDLSPRAQSAVLSEVAPDMAVYDKALAA